MFRLFAFLLVGSFVVTGLSAQGVDPISQNLTVISLQVTVLETAVNAFPETGGNSDEVNAICRNLTILESLFINSTALPSDTTNWGSVIIAFQGMARRFFEPLGSIVEKKPAFQALSPTGDIPTCLPETLGKLNTTAGIYVETIYSKAPIFVKLAINGDKRRLFHEFHRIFLAFF